MSSRIKEKVEHFFECFCEVVPPRDDKDAWIIQQFPDKYKDQEVLKLVPKFAYPYKFENTVIQHYSFVLTDLDSKWTFGFCRHDPKSETAIIVLSYLPWHQSFYKFLDTTAVLMHSSRAEDLREFLSIVYNTKIAEPGKKFTISFNRGQSTFAVDVPRPFLLPSIPENRNLTEYYNAVDTNNMMIVFASMLNERRIIFTSKQLKRLSACVQSANDIIYPMIWQHLFIPVLPQSLVDYLSAPMPYLIGVPADVLHNVSRPDIGDVVILDADSNTVESPFDDLNNLPQDVVASLRKQLRNKSAVLGDGVSRAFLRALVQLIGGYRDALKFQPGQKVVFDKDKFIETRPVPLQPFLKEMLNLQIFQQFIEERLMMLNTGRGFSDEFEFELENYSAKSGSKLKQQYKEWTSSMRKEGTAFFKSVKDKANPAMKSAVRTVKDGGKGMKSAYKGLRSKLKEGQGAPGAHQLPNGVGKDTKPRSAPNSPTGKRKGLSGFSVPVATYKKDASLAIKNANLQRSYSPLTPGSQPLTPDALDTPRSGSPIEIPRIDLMNEMQELFKLRLDTTPPVDRSLKPVRSLENFKSSPNSPEKWATLALPRPSLPPPSTSSRPFSTHHDTQGLLQSPLDDAFLSPPHVPPRKASDFLTGGDGPFVVAGDHNENGDQLFYVTGSNRNVVDIVKLAPPVQCSPNRRKQAEDTEDLIRLDSTSDFEDFDPLNSSPSVSSYSTPTHPQVPPLSISNPLYRSSYENHEIRPRDGSSLNAFTRQDQDLLQDYGLNFNFVEAQQSSRNTAGTTNFRGQFATAAATAAPSGKVNTQINGKSRSYMTPALTGPST